MAPITPDNWAFFHYPLYVEAIYHIHLNIWLLPLSLIVDMSHQTIGINILQQFGFKFNI